MNFITKKTDYAIRALIELNNADKPLSVNYMIRKLSIPKAFLRNILQTLAKENILHSTKGIGGGFVLAKSAKKIYLTDIIKIFQGPIKLNKCLFRKKICPHKNTCPLREKIKDIENYALKQLSSTTIKTLSMRQKRKEEK